MNKLIQDGKVGVVYSPEFGAGWYTWNTKYPELVFDPVIVEYVESEQMEKLEIYIRLKYPTIFLGALPHLIVEWVPQGEEFRITEYDGKESIELKRSTTWLIA
jgi:hypothetical protein